MPKLKRVSGKQAIAALKRLGFEDIRQKGSHIILTKETPNGRRGCVIPVHKELAVGTLRGILRQAGISVADFMKNL